MVDDNAVGKALLAENASLRARLLDAEQRLAVAASPSSSAALDALRDLERVYDEAERVAHVGRWVIDVKTERLVWSDELFRILGCDPATVVPSLEAYYAAVHPDDVAIVRARAERWATGDVEPSEFRVLWRDGTVRDVRANGTVIRDAHGAPVKLVGTALDITDTKRAYQQLERAVALLAETQRIASVGGWMLEIPSGKLEWSEQFAQILGLASDAVPSAELFLSRVHPEDRARLVRSHADALAEGSGRVECRVLRPDGTIRHVDLVGTPVHAEGRLVGLRGTMLDVTERVLLEEQLSRAKKLEALGTLAGGVAHDFNNLLTVIFGNLELLSRHVMPKGYSFLEGIGQAAELAGQLTSQLLAFGRKAPLERRVIDLNASLSRALGIARRLLGDTVEIEACLHPDLWQVSADETQLHQIVLNLTVNARDAMPHGGRIRVSTRNTVAGAGAPPVPLMPAGQYVILEVSDEGIGMDEATKARVFEPFFTTKSSARGAGLGLAVVFGAVAQHDGFIELDSRPAEGATFRIYFPRAVDAERELSPTRPSLAAGEPTGASILLIEDDPAVAATMCAALASAGYRVTLAQLPSHALSLWRDAVTEFDLVISDVSMPEMRGPELVRRMAQHREPRRVLFATGYALELFEGAVETRHYPVLQKPFKAAQLIATVAELLRS